MLDFNVSVVLAWPPQTSDWVGALECRSFTIGARRVTLEVQGIIEDGDHRWIQVASVENSTFTMLLHIFPGADIRDVVRALLAIPYRHPWPATLDVRGKD